MQNAVPPQPSLNRPPSKGKAVCALVSGILSPVILVVAFGALVLAVRQTLSPFIVGLIAVMVLGVVCALALIAIICGHLSLSAIRRSPEQNQGMGMSITGLVLGYLVIVLLIVWIVSVGAISEH